MCIHKYTVKELLLEVDLIKIIGRAFMRDDFIALILYKGNNIIEHECFCIKSVERKTETNTVNEEEK